MNGEDLVEDLYAMNARQLVRWLTTPSRCGFYLSADDLARLGRELGVSVSPFNRAGALEQLLRGAALDDCLNDALEALRVEMERQLVAYRTLELSALSGWVEQAEATVSAWRAIERTFLEQSGGRG